MLKAVLPVLCLATILLAACATAPRPQPKDQHAAESQRRTEALRLVDAHRFTDAEPTLQEIQKAHPDDAMVKLGLGECALGMGRLDEAGTLFASLADDPTYRPKALQGLGIALVRRGDAQTATAALEQATAMEPNLWRAWNGLGQAYDIQHMWDASKHAYEHALQNTPDAGIIYNNRGMSLLAQERYDDALKAFDQARIADPTLAAVETNRQLTLALQQRFPEATFATRPEEKAKLLNNAGYVALMKGDYDRAEQLFVQAAETSPTYYAQAHNNLQVLEQVRAKSQGNHS